MSAFVLAALGDSFTCGAGVGVGMDPRETWVALLADALPGAQLHRVAVPGARVRDVRSRQLPALVHDPPAVATVLAGLNDVIRSGFDAPRLRADLGHVVGELRAAGATVLVATVPDPMRPRPVPLPVRIRRRLSARAAEVNAAVAAITAADPGALLVDLAALPGLANSRMWAVDRAHPAPAGHRLFARAAADALRGCGWAVAAIPAGPVPPAPRTAARTRWLIRHGLPWLLRHGGRVAPALGTMSRESSGRTPTLGAGTS